MSRERLPAVVVSAVVLAAGGATACGTGTQAPPAASWQTPVAVQTSAPAAAAAAAPRTTVGAAASAKPAATVGPRDKFRQPYASTSVWNTAIGSKAKYVEASIGSTGIGVDTVHIHKVKSSDPVVASYDANAFVGRRCEGSRPQPQAQWHPELARVRLPSGLRFPDANLDPQHYFTPNGKLVLLMPDGKTLRQFLPACRQTRGGPLYGYAFPAQNVYGDGLCCGHGGSALSAMGGTLRKGELTSADPIRHALAINLWGRYLHFDHAKGNGHVWPASMHDGGAPGNYRGSDPALTMGSLLAVPPTVSEAGLKLETAAGRKLFRAMRDYGSYVVDDSGQNSQDLNIEKSAEDELVSKVTGGVPVWQYKPLSRDFTKIMKTARVVVNNGPKSVGGGGTPRAPRAPRIGN